MIVEQYRQQLSIVNDLIEQYEKLIADGRDYTVLTGQAARLLQEHKDKRDFLEQEIAKQTVTGIVRTFKQRTGFGRWSTIIVYRCKCGNDMNIRQNWNGSSPPGAFRCSKCHTANRI